MIRRVQVALIGLFLTLMGGTLVFHFVEDESLFDSIYFTIITLTTVGYGDITPQTPEGKIAVVLTILVGVGLFGVLIGSITEMMVEGQLRHVLGRKRVEKEITSLKDHFIVCGFGRIGKIVCRELHHSSVPFVVIENDTETIRHLDEEEYLYLEGDATEDAILEKAGIDHARGLVAVLGTDAENVYLTMSARDLNRKLMIVARGEDERTSRKLSRAGASRVVSPAEIGGRRMAHTILKPNVIDFIEATTRAGTEIDLEEIHIHESSRFTGKTLADSGIREEFDLIIVAIRKPDGRMTFNPSHLSVIQADDVLITMGPSENQGRLAEAAN